MESALFVVFCYSLRGCFCNSFLVKGPIDMRPVSIKREGQWTFFTTFHFTPLVELHVKNLHSFCNNFRQQEDRDMTVIKSNVCCIYRKQMLTFIKTIYVRFLTNDVSLCHCCIGDYQNHVLAFCIG